MKKKRFLTFTMACVMTLALAVGLAACGHEHTMTEVKAVEATCTSAGNSAYYVCSDCGKYFSDAEGANEIEKDSWIVNAKGHSYGAWTADTAATFFGKGVEKRVCANDATHTETRSISAIGCTAGVFDAFNVYSDACVQGQKGIILKKDVENETGASTYFGEADKNFDWNGSKMTLSFDLDLSALNEADDYTQFILAFNYENGEQFVHADEIRFGIVKTENGFVVNQMSGASDDASNIAAIKGEGAQTFTDVEISAAFTFEYDKETKEFTYSMTVAGKSFDEVTRTEVNDLVGLRYLWNARLNKDGVELSNITLA